MLEQEQLFTFSVLLNLDRVYDVSYRDFGYWLFFNTRHKKIEKKTVSDEEYTKKPVDSSDLPQGVLSITAHTGRLRPKWVSFSGLRYIKGQGFHQLK